MCGILGILSGTAAPITLPDSAVVAMRDRLAHRGPDDAGLLRRDHIVLAHRRLAVLDVSPSGHQPMVSPCGRWALVYNGELYNDAALRTALLTPPAPDEALAPGYVASPWSPPRFTSTGDTQTILYALARWGTHALARLRGMYALAFVDFARRTALLTRDPLGIKPLYLARVTHGQSHQVLFASEIPALLAHPALAPRPDFQTIRSYFATIRTTCGRRTLFAGIETLLPGEFVEIDLHPPAPALRRGSTPHAPAASTDASESLAQATSRIGTAVTRSIHAHLRSDVPLCCLLSGGLDSAIVTTVTAQELRRRSGCPQLLTYCAGAKGAASAVPGVGDDFEFAAQVASASGTRHAEAVVDAELFGHRWRALIHSTGLPLSTPNEVAINEVARRLRADGNIVTLSGEGADELFGGYETPLRQAAEFTAGQGPWAGCHPGDFQLQTSAWAGPAQWPALFAGPLSADLGDGAAQLAQEYRTIFEAEAQRLGSEGLAAHLAFQRRVNLAGLLLRLDSAAMQAGVEGRTPLADIDVWAAADATAIDHRFLLDPAGFAHTKRVLRAAFAEVLPPAVVSRPKASFPLPFIEWLRPQVDALAHGPAREWFTPAAAITVAEMPERVWSLAWPMLNIAMWARRWWGDGSIKDRKTEHADARQREPAIAAPQSVDQTTLAPTSASGHRF